MRKSRILVADDEPNIVRLVRASLEQAGYEVVEVLDGEQALQVFKSTSPDLVLLDVVMPKLDGFEVCRRIREASSVPIIMLSAMSDEGMRDRALRMGANDYMVKPFRLEELVRRVEAALRERRGG